jgi:DNA-binding MarR family transcriptional regulator
VSTALVDVSPGHHHVGMRERTDVDGEVRPHTRRHGPRVYLTERIGTGERLVLRDEIEPAGVDMLRAAGATGSALRRRLRELGIDPKLARLVLVLQGWNTMRASDVAWRSNVSKTTASRHLDEAERAGLVDKLYKDFDRRGTWVRLTRRGRHLRRQVLDVLVSLDSERPAGPAHGARSNRPYFSKNE